MTLTEHPIGELVARCQTWDPRADGGGDFQYIDLGSIDKDSKKLTTIETYRCADAPSRARQLVKTDDVLVATVRPNLNGVALVNGIHNGMTASTGYCVLRPNEDKLDSRYLFHWVKTETFVNRMVSVATGANYPAVSDGKVKDSKIPLPPLAEQKRIAGILDAADALRAKRREALAQLDSLLQATFLDLFGDPVKGRELAFDELALRGRGTFSNGPFGSELLTSELVDSGVPVVYIRDIRNGEYKRVSTVHVTSKKAGQLDACRVIPGDILIAKVGDPPGIAASYPPDEPTAVVTQDVIRVRANPDIVTPEFVVSYLNSHPGMHMIKGITVEATRARFSLGDLKRLRLSIPPLERQQKFSCVVKSVGKLKAGQRAHLAELNTLFASLQSRAFRGEL